MPKAGKAPNKSLNPVELKSLKSFWEKMDASKKDLVSYYRQCRELAAFLHNTNCSAQTAASSLDVSVRLIHYCVDIADNCGIQFVSKVAKLRNRKGSSLSPTHLRTLAMASPNDRDALVSLWQEHSLTTQQLDQRAKELANASRPSNPTLNRKRRFSRKELDAVRKMLEKIGATLSRMEASDLEDLAKDYRSELQDVLQEIDDVHTKLTSCQKFIGRQISASEPKGGRSSA